MAAATPEIDSASLIRTARARHSSVSLYTILNAKGRMIPIFYLAPGYRPFFGPSLAVSSSSTSES